LHFLKTWNSKLAHLEFLELENGPFAIPGSRKNGERHRTTHEVPWSNPVSDFPGGWYFFWIFSWIPEFPILWPIFRALSGRFSQNQEWIRIQKNQIYHPAKFQVLTLNFVTGIWFGPPHETLESPHGIPTGSPPTKKFSHGDFKFLEFQLNLVKFTGLFEMIIWQNWLSQFAPNFASQFKMVAHFWFTHHSFSHFFYFHFQSILTMYLTFGGSLFTIEMLGFQPDLSRTYPRQMFL